MTENEIAKIIVDAAYYVHKKLGLHTNFALDLIAKLILLLKCQSPQKRQEKQNIGFVSYPNPAALMDIREKLKRLPKWIP